MQASKRRFRATVPCDNYIKNFFASDSRSGLHIAIVKSIIPITQNTKVG